MAQFSLAEAIGVDNSNIHEKIEGIYISHAHSDHVGGLEWVALCTKFNPACKKPLHLYAVDKLIMDIWDKSLRGGLETLEGKVANLTDFFRCHAIPENKSFKWRNITFTPMQTIHIMSGMMFQNSYGLLLQEGDGEIAFITTDTQFAPKQLAHFYQKASVIFHDCSTAFPDPVHAFYGDLVGLPEEVKNKMWLYHYQPNPQQDPDFDGFRGFVKRGEVYTIL